MPAKIYNVCLTDEPIQYLFDIIHTGKHSARKINRSRILLPASSGQSDEEIVYAVHTGPSTVQRVGKRFVKEGPAASPEEKPRPGQTPKPGADDEALLTATACSEAPEGRSPLTPRLPADRPAELKTVPSVSHVAIGSLLKKRPENVAE